VGAHGARRPGHKSPDYHGYVESYVMTQQAFAIYAFAESRRRGTAGMIVRSPWPDVVVPTSPSRLRLRHAERRSRPAGIIDGRRAGR